MCGEVICNPADRSRELKALIAAANTLEDCIKNDPVGPSPATVKNAGIAYSKLVQGKFPPKITDPLTGKGYPFHVRIKVEMVQEGHLGDWSEHASYLTLKHWKRFISMPGADKDPSYDSVKQIVTYLAQTDARTRQSTKTNIQENKKTKKAKKKKTKKAKKKKKKSKSKKKDES